MVVVCSYKYTYQDMFIYQPSFAETLWCKVVEGVHSNTPTCKGQPTYIYRPHNEHIAINQKHFMKYVLASPCSSSLLGEEPLFPPWPAGPMRWDQCPKNKQYLYHILVNRLVLGTTDHFYTYLYMYTLHIIAIAQLLNITL